MHPSGLRAEAAGRAEVVLLVALLLPVLAAQLGAVANAVAQAAAVGAPAAATLLLQLPQLLQRVVQHLQSSIPDDGSAQNPLDTHDNHITKPPQLRRSSAHVQQALQVPTASPSPPCMLCL